jgi:nucleoside diphosphate kinase
MINSGNIHAFALGIKDAIQEWCTVIGPADPDVARKESPSR